MVVGRLHYGAMATSKCLRDGVHHHLVVHRGADVALRAPEQERAWRVSTPSGRGGVAGIQSEVQARTGSWSGRTAQGQAHNVSMGKDGEWSVVFECSRRTLKS